MLLIAVVVLLYCSIVKGQTAFGLKGGLSIANITHNTHKPRVTGHGGVFVHRTINKNWCVQPELLYSGEGQRYLWNDGEHVSALSYLQLPIMIQYYPVSQVYLEVGPQFGLLITAKDKIADGGSHTDWKVNMATGEFAIAAGLGIKATDQVIVYGRYNFGLTDVTSLDQIIHHSNVGQIGVAIRFHQ